MVKLIGELDESAVAVEDLPEDDDGQAEEEQPGTEVEPDDDEIDAATDYTQNVADASAQVALSAVEWSKAQEDAKTAKKQFDAAVEALRRIISRGPQILPLFDQADTVVESDADDLEWRSRDLGELDGLTENLLDKLGIETIGELEDLRKDISFGKSKWPKGIGPAAVTKIEDAVLNWLRDNGPCRRNGNHR